MKIRTRSSQASKCNSSYFLVTFKWIGICTILFLLCRSYSNLNNLKNWISINTGSNTSQPSLRTSKKDSTVTNHQPITTTSENDVEKSLNKDGPHKRKFSVIHVGPHKTGSSSLQISIFKKKVIKDALKEDNYRVPIFRQGQFAVTDTMRPEEYPAKNHAMFADCLLGSSTMWNIFCPPEIANSTMTYFENFVNDAARDGSHILLSSEEFDRHVLDIPKLLSYLEPHNYNIHVVLYYRRFHDWIFSTYNQQMKVARGNQVMTFEEWLDYKIEQVMSHYTGSVYERLKSNPSFNGDVSVVNMHKDITNIDSLEAFFCHHVEQTPHTCNTAKSEK